MNDRRIHSVYNRSRGQWEAWRDGYGLVQSGFGPTETEAILALYRTEREELKGKSEMSPDIFVSIQVGDLVRHLMSDHVCVVTAVYGNRITAVRTYDITNPTEWQYVTPLHGSELPMKSVFLVRRHAVLPEDEGRDFDIKVFDTRTEAKAWILSQAKEYFRPSDYYIVALPSA